MLAYHNDPSVKAKYVARLQAHRAAENLIQGTGWGNGKGCAVGCTLEQYSHERYPIELGVPEELARLEDRIFEGLPKGKAEQFAVDFLEAIPVGADLANVCRLLAIERHKLALIRLEGNAEPYAEQVRNAINGVLEYLNAPSESAAWSAWSAAWSARSAARSARSAARSAESAAWSAAWSARSARSAESAAWSAAWSARSAARSAESAESDHYEWEAATLINLLKVSK